MIDDPKTDTNRYYYRPGTTEPELRPEIAEAEAAKETKETAKAEKSEAKTAKPVAKKK